MQGKSIENDVFGSDIDRGAKSIAGIDVGKLPNFVILGAVKAGTTTLYEYLRAHPEVYPGYIKEPQFFCNDLLFNKGLSYYLETYFDGAENYSARGDASPQYLYYEKAARRLGEVLPESHQRFIVVVRDPVERAYSLYWNMVHEGHENLSFEEALEAEPGRIGDPDNARHGRVRYEYVESGLYAKQLRRYFQYFDPAKFLIILYDDLVEHREEVLKTVFRFVGVSDDVQIVPQVHANPAGVPRFRNLQNWLRQPRWAKRQLGRLLPFRVKYELVSLLLKWNKKPTRYPPMNRATRSGLRERFREDILDLETIIGRSLNQWLVTDLEPSKEPRQRV